MKKKVASIEREVRNQLKDEGTGHDWWHVCRVRNLAVHISEEEGADTLVVELGALLHDIADHKFNGGDYTIGPRRAKDLLQKAGFSDVVSEKVVRIVENVSYSKSYEGNALTFLELEIVQDADRIDALGAIGIARAFAYGGFKDRPLYDPEKDDLNALRERGYTNSSFSTIGHFYEKLLKLKDSIHTKTGKKIAENRHQVLLSYLDEFFGEWKGEK